MSTPLKVLIVEDSERDAELSLGELQRAGYEPESLRVETAEAMSAALDGQSWDIIIADWNMPRFSAPAALALLKKAGRDIPFLVVSGSIGEAQAVEAMRNGAHDYIMKDRLLRLAPAVSRELREAELRREHRVAEEAVYHLASFPDKDPNPVVEIELPGKVAYINPAGRSAFSDLSALGLGHPALEGFASVLEKLATDPRREHLREITFEDHCYLATFTRLLDLPIVRCYFVDITARKRAEEELLLKNALLEAQSETAIDGILAVNAKGQAILWNKRFAEMWHIPAELLATQDDKEMLAQVRGQLEAPEQFLDKIKHLYSHPSEKSRDEIALKDGRTLDRYSSPLPFQDGSSPGRIWYFRDITERKRFEAAIIRAKQEWERTFDAVPDLIALIDVNHRMIRVNQAMAARLGSTPRQLVGQPCYEVVHGLSAPPGFCPHAKLLTSGKEERAEVVEERLRGTFDVSATPLRDAAGCLIGSVHVARDITERKEAALALCRSEERFRTLFQRSPVGVLLADRDSRLLDVNDTLCRMLGYSRDELLLLTVLEITHPEDGAMTAGTPQTVTEGNRAEFSVEKRYVRKDGSILWVGVSLAAVNGADGKFSYGIAVVQDISERKRAEEESLRSADKLRKMMDGTIKAMTSALEMRDPYTAGHERRVAQLACAIAADMGIPAWQIEGIRFASYLHDIGKIAVPAEILSKPGKITENEFGIIKTHPQTGYDILKEINFLWPVALATLQHHERLNGAGYPRGLCVEKIILEARIIAVADVVEAMSSHRPYRPALGTEAALAEIAANRGILYDPRVADACARLFAEKRFQFEQASAVAAPPS